MSLRNRISDFTRDSVLNLIHSVLSTKVQCTKGSIFVGRKTAGSGYSEELEAADAKTILGTTTDGKTNPGKILETDVNGKVNVTTIEADTMAALTGKFGTLLNEDGTDAPYAPQGIGDGLGFKTTFPPANGVALHFRPIVTVADATERKMLSSYDPDGVFLGSTLVMQSDLPDVLWKLVAADVTQDASWIGFKVTVNPDGFAGLYLQP